MLVREDALREHEKEFREAQRMRNGLNAILSYIDRKRFYEDFIKPIKEGSGDFDSPQEEDEFDEEELKDMDALLKSLDQRGSISFVSPNAGNWV